MSTIFFYSSWKYHFRQSHLVTVAIIHFDYSFHSHFISKYAFFNQQITFLIPQLLHVKLYR